MHALEALTRKFTNQYLCSAHIYLLLTFLDALTWVLESFSDTTDKNVDKKFHRFEQRI